LGNVWKKNLKQKKSFARKEKDTPVFPLKDKPIPSVLCILTDREQLYSTSACCTNPIRTVARLFHPTTLPTRNQWGEGYRIMAMQDSPRPRSEISFLISLPSVSVGFLGWWEMGLETSQSGE